MSSPERTPPANGTQKRQRADGADGDAEPDAKRIATVDKDGGVTHIAKPDDKSDGETLTHPIQSTASASNPAGRKTANENDPNLMHVRSKHSSKESSILIGRGGTNVNTIRNDSGAKIAISTYSKGVVERVITTIGEPTVIPKAYRLMAITLNSEASAVGAEYAAVTQTGITLLIPEVLAGAVLGDNFARVREIMAMSGAHVNLSGTNLGNSTERTLDIHAVPSGIETAVFEVVKTMELELVRRFGSAAASAYATREGAPLSSGTNPGALLCVAWHPRPTTSSWNYQYQRPAYNAAAPYGHAPVSAFTAGMQQPNQVFYNHQGWMPHGGEPGAQAFTAPQYDPHRNIMTSNIAVTEVHGYGQAVAGHPGTKMTQIYIPNDMVGAVIGKQGAKINDIRGQSGANIKINESQEGRNDRLVTITGTDAQNRIALGLLQQRIDSEKHRGG